ncbi:MAG: sigma-70 family RNA polymerase sigma factor [Oscillospiraceae bacterium]|nr:sigma-70 family RNA polymerase sigma factor [Oscillospiraceae bacterium]
MDFCEPLLFDESIDIETIVNTYSHALLRYCHSILCDYHEAQDVLQITFIKAWQNKNKFSGDDKDLSNYLYKIAYNSCIDAIRRRKQRLKNPAEPAKQNQDHIPENIKSALMILCPLDRAIAYSHAVDDISFAELAEIYGKTAAALRKRYERARKKLSKILSEGYPNYQNYRKGANNNDE